MQIAIALFDGVEALDAVGPYAVLTRVADGGATFVAEAAGPVVDSRGTPMLVAGAAFTDVPRPDVIVVPGGRGARAMARDGGPLVDWVRDVHATTAWTTSVCTGSLILGAAGVLDGLRATTHWMATDALAALGATPVAERVVIEREARVVTGAGVSAGIDMALTLAAELASPRRAQEVQLLLEYAPEPPFTAGSPATAPPEVVAALRARSAAAPAPPA